MAGRDLYIVQSAMTGAVKVGRSDDPERRLKELQVGAPYRLKLILVMPSGGVLEKRVHRELKMYRTRQGDGEWFREDCTGTIPVAVYEWAARWWMEDQDWWKR